MKALRIDDVGTLFHFGDEMLDLLERVALSEVDAVQVQIWLVEFDGAVIFHCDVEKE